MSHSANDHHPKENLFNGELVREESNALGANPPSHEIAHMIVIAHGQRESNVRHNADLLSRRTAALCDALGLLQRWNALCLGWLRQRLQEGVDIRQFRV